MINVSEKIYKDIVKKVGKEKMTEIEQDSGKPSDQDVVTVQAAQNADSLEKNTADIIELHSGVSNMLIKGLEDALKIGELLFAQKDIIKSNGDLFIKWAKDNMPFTIRTAQRYMKLFHYKDELQKKNIKTLTDAYAHINGEPITDEIVDADDSLKLGDVKIVTQANLDTLELPKKKAKGPAKAIYLNKQAIDNLISGDGYEGCQGRCTKFVVELQSGNVHNKRIGEFVCAAEKYLKHGGKIIFHKR